MNELFLYIIKNLFVPLPGNIRFRAGYLCYTIVG